MTIRDRGKKKWQGAFFMPEQVKMQRELWMDTQRQIKPLIDEQETEEFDQRIGYAMEYNHQVKVTVWVDGFTVNITGRIHYIDPISKQLRIEVKSGEFERITFTNVVNIIVIE